MMNKYIVLKDKITDIIKNDPVVKQIYENNGGCFKNVVVPSIMNAEDNEVLETVIMMLATQSKFYDALIDNISQFGNKELIKKCNDDINSITNSYLNNKEE